MKKDKLHNPISDRFTEEFHQNDPLISLGDLNDIHKHKTKILLHSCCGPCSTSVIERLCEFYDITIFFYNPNISDREEYNKRLASQIEFIDKYNISKDSRGRISFMEGTYEPEMFNTAFADYEHEPEGGKRCTVCFKLRLEKTAETASISGFDCFGTTLTVSPHKNFELIHRIGMQLGMRYGLTFLDEDFKKRAGFQRSIELSKEYNLYRQNYCGCRFSK